MPTPGEPALLRLAARGLVVALVAMAAIPAYLTLGPAWRPLGVRLACACLVAAGCVRAVRHVRRAVADDPPFAFDAPHPHALAPEPDDRFVRLREELTFSVRSRRYFDTILWPRLQRLAGPGLTAPAERRRLRHDGPTLRELDRLLAEVEKRA